MGTKGRAVFPRSPGRAEESDLAFAKRNDCLYFRGPDNRDFNKFFSRDRRPRSVPFDQGFFGLEEVIFL